jgi:tetratricopeptide (TPR) repeat protein
VAARGGRVRLHIWRSNRPAVALLARGGYGRHGHSLNARGAASMVQVLGDAEEQTELGCLAARLVALCVPMQSDAEFWKKRKRIIAHGLHVSGWIIEDGGSDKEGAVEALISAARFYSLGYLLADEDRPRAEQMYQRALQGYEKAWGPGHTSPLDTVNNLGVLYCNLGRLNEAEKMYQRALDGYAKAISAETLMTCVPVLNNMWALASLRENQGRVEDARYWYSQALRSHEKTFRTDHDKCESLRTSLASLIGRRRGTMLLC